MPAEGPAAPGRLLVFRVGRGRFALPLEAVRGIQPAAEAGPRDSVVFHGRSLAVVDARSLRWRRDVDGEREAPPTLVVVAGGGGERALAVDAVEGIVESAGIREWPALVAPYVRRSFLGVALQPEGELLVVDPAALHGAAGRNEGGPGRA